jgi:hypothetical protein
MTSITEKNHAGSFILSEADGHLSRENVTIDNGANLYPGTVLGKSTATGKYVQLDLVTTGGAEVAAAILIGEAFAASVEVAAAVIVRDAEVLGKELLWPDGFTDNEKAAALAQLASNHVIAR